MFHQTIGSSFLFWVELAAIYAGTLLALMAWRWHYPILPPYRGDKP